MARYTITPWRAQADLLSVRQSLYRLNPDGADFRRHAVDRVMAWKVRGNLPHAVESTALLIDAILHHDLANNSIFSIRAVYSAAFTRFVTGFCDIGRNRERALEPSSMLEIARQIDMPPEFVALRHEATHEELPSVQRLVVVCDQALEWLWRVYWSRLEEPQTESTNAMSGEQVKDEARRLFKEYRGAMRRILKQKTQSVQERDDLVQRTSNACATLCRTSDTSPDDVAEVMIVDRVLLPSDRRLGAPMEGAFVLWEDLMLALAEQHEPFLFRLIERMVIAISEPSSLERPTGESEKEAFYLWLMRIASSERWQETSSTSGYQPSIIISECCLHPAEWTYKLGQALLALEADDEDFVERWSELVETYADPGQARFHNANTQMEEDDTVENHVGTSEPYGTNEAPEGFGGVDEPGGWREALLPMSTPIGTVR